jgi:predicted component of type VI protein secretion system
MPLRVPAVVVSTDVERELWRGSLGIGRHPNSDILLNDPLVSRSHARLIVLEDGSIAIEDLHSANGVYVNGERLGRSFQVLHDGDRLLLGTCELGVFASRRLHDDEKTPSIRPSERRLLESASEAPPATDRADALQMVARLAERLHRAGNSPEAIRVLSAHLNKVLLGASAGLAVPDSLLEQASRHALELYYWTYNGAWIDYVVELHLATQSLPSEKSLAALETAISGAQGTHFDSALLKYFAESMEPQRTSMTLNEEARLSRLGRLAR